jgi:hypothetical protein
MFAKGCVITILAGVTLFFVVVGGTWFLYYRVVQQFTARQPVQIATASVTDSAYQEAEQRLSRLSAAATEGKRETIEFTAADVNALFARHPGFAHPHRKIRVSMADSLMTLEMSVPFEKARLPHLNGRWLNGIGVFSFEYVYGQFNIVPKGLVANGHPLPQMIYSENFMSSFNRSFTRSFFNATSANHESAAFWRNIRSITVRGDKLVVMTEPAV